MMKSLSPYLKMLTQSNLLYFPLILGVLLGIDWIGLILDIASNSYDIQEGVVIIISNMYFNMGLILFIIGVILSTSKFNIAINIKADRKNYIKAILLYIVVYSLLFTIINMGIEFIIEQVISYRSGLNVLIVNNNYIFRDVFSNNQGLMSVIVENLATMAGIQFAGSETVALGIFYGEFDLLYYIIDNLKLWLSLIMYSSIGLFIGALVYRLKKLTSILIFVSIPVLTIGCIISDIILGNQVIIQKLLDIYLIERYHFMLDWSNIVIIKLIVITICIISSILLLKKAPIKEYAHDLF